MLTWTEHATIVIIVLFQINDMYSVMNSDTRYQMENKAWSFLKSLFVYVAGPR